MTVSDSPALLARRRRAHAIRRWVMAVAASMFIALGVVIADQTHGPASASIASRASSGRVLTAASGSQASGSTGSVSASSSSAPLTTSQS